jgi:hypothetical protein
MQKPMIEARARAWLAESKRIQSNITCGCGCGEQIAVRRFKSGHDANLSRYRETIRKITRE